MSEQNVQRRNEQLAESPYALLCRYAEMHVNIDPLQSTQEYSAISYLGFGVGEENFLLRVNEVRSVLNELPYLTRLPFAPGWLLGLSSVRGEIVSVVAFAQIVKQQGGRSSSTARAHYILLGGSGSGFLLKVDRLFGISRAGIEDALDECEDADRPFVDARGDFEGKDWQRLNLEVLLQNALSE